MMAVAGLFCLTASAQYPQLTDEAKQLIEQQKKQWKAHSDSAWEVAFPIVGSQRLRLGSSFPDSC